jgi:hypothetical protein
MMSRMRVAVTGEVEHRCAMVEPVSRLCRYGLIAMGKGVNLLGMDED